MKKNVIFRIAAVVLMCALVTACFASSTFAKYTSAGDGESSVTVAKWDIDVDSADIAEDHEFDLFDTIKDEDGSDEEDVNDGLVAPGTSGEFIVKVENKSEVTAEIDLSVTVPGYDFFEVTLDDADNLDKVGDIYTLAAGKTANVKYTWVWEIDANDADTDNALGDGNTEITANVAITATQYQ